MEPLRIRTALTRRRACLAIAAAPFWLAGCVTTPIKKDDPAAADKAAQNAVAKASDPMAATKFVPHGDGRLVLTVSNKVQMAPDTIRGGAMNPGLIGRIHLFHGDASGSGVPFTAPGELVVDLFDHTPKAGVVEPKLLERWRFGDGMLDKFAKKDRVGDGYTVFLPWSTHSLACDKVLLQARYTSDDGKLAVMNQTGVLTVDHSAYIDTTSGRVGAENGGQRSTILGQ